MRHLCSTIYLHVLDAGQSSDDERMSSAGEHECSAASHAFSTCANWRVQNESCAKRAYFRLNRPARFITRGLDSELKRYLGLAAHLAGAEWSFGFESSLALRKFVWLTM